MRSEEGPPQSGDRASGVDEQVRGTEDEGRRAAAASPPIADDAAKEQTQTPAPGDETGVPEMNQPDE
jgi:hypothetical protein